MTDYNYDNDPFIGTWVLDPAQSKYELGTPPKSGTYILEPDGEGLKISMTWETAEGQNVEVSYFGIPDGKNYPYEDNPAVVDAMSMTRVDVNTLDSTAQKDGQVILYARRVLSEGGTVMTVTQSGLTPDGGQYSNVSAYNKQ
jgi:hypothetical protein